MLAACRETEERDARRMTKESKRHDEEEEERERDEAEAGYLSDFEDEGATEEVQEESSRRRRNKRRYAITASMACFFVSCRGGRGEERHRGDSATSGGNIPSKIWHGSWYLLSTTAASAVKKERGKKKENAPAAWYKRARSLIAVSREHPRLVAAHLRAVFRA